MKNLDIAEYKPEKEYSADTKFVLDDTPYEVTIPQFLKDNKNRLKVSNGENYNEPKT